MRGKPHICRCAGGRWAYIYAGVIGIGYTIAYAQADWLSRYEMSKIAEESCQP